MPDHRWLEHVAHGIEKASENVLPLHILIGITLNLSSH
jgi:hypothetical protein